MSVEEHAGLLVHLVCLVYLVSLIQPNTQNKPDKPNNQLDGFGYDQIGQFGE
jgi:hypothetical protein